jgi:hypothetical protein
MWSLGAPDAATGDKSMVCGLACMSLKARHACVSEAPQSWTPRKRFSPAPGATPGWLGW